MFFHVSNQTYLIVIELNGIKVLHCALFQLKKNKINKKKERLRATALPFYSAGYVSCFWK